MILNMAKKKKKNQFASFIISFWKGEKSLLQSFWVYFLVGGYVLSLPSIFTQDNDFYLLLNIALYWTYLIWATVGTWRSASNYAKIKKDKKIWSIFAKIFIILEIVIIWVLPEF